LAAYELSGDVTIMRVLDGVNITRRLACSALPMR
jgi:hypothetical protein